MTNTLSFFFELVKTNAIISRRLSVHGLDFSDFMILCFLSEAEDGRLRRIDLADKLGLTASGITRMLLPLEKLHVVQRDFDKSDARARYASLTAAGKQLFEDASKTINQKIEDIIPETFLSKIENFTKLLQEMNQQPKTMPLKKINRLP